MLGWRDDEFGDSQGRGGAVRRGVVRPWPIRPARPSSALHRHSSRITLARRRAVSKDLCVVIARLASSLFGEAALIVDRAEIVIFRRELVVGDVLHHAVKVISSQFTWEPKP
jgi:transposase